MIKELKDENQDDMISLLQTFAPDQLPFVTGDYFAHGKTFCFGYYKDNILCGCISYCVQDIGKEQLTPLVKLNQEVLKEAKISSFLVHPDYRNQGIGKALQRYVIKSATAYGCYQLASYSTFDKLANYSVKLSLGFCVQPETQPDGTVGCFFLKRL